MLGLFYNIANFNICFQIIQISRKLGLIIFHDIDYKYYKR